MLRGWVAAGFRSTEVQKLQLSHKKEPMRLLNITTTMASSESWGDSGLAITHAANQRSELHTVISPFIFGI